MAWNAITNNTVKNKQQTTVAVCVPTQGLVHAEFTHALVNLVQYSEQNNFSIKLIMHQGTVLSNQRQHIAVEALESNPDYLFWLDSDMTFPPDTLLQLAEIDQSVVCAAYSKRVEPFIPTAFLDIDPVQPVKINGAIQRVRYAGMGCMLVKAAIMHTLPMPWFPLIWHEPSRSWHGEDMGFCALLEKNNIEIWCDTKLSLELGHLGTKKYRLDDLKDW